MVCIVLLYIRYSHNKQHRVYEFDVSHVRMVGSEEKSVLVAPGLLEALSGLSALSDSSHAHQHYQAKVASAVKLIPLTLRAQVRLSLVTRGFVRLLFLNENIFQAEKDWKYVLNRLVRGTAAGRASSREGFFAALVTLLAEKHDISAGLVLETLNKQLPLGNQSKSVSVYLIVNF